MAGGVGVVDLRLNRLVNYEEKSRTSATPWLASGKDKGVIGINS